MLKKNNIGWICLGVVLVCGGCRSVPPPEPKPAAVLKVEQLALTAASVSEAGNWVAAENTWQEVAAQYGELDRREEQAVALHNQAVAAFRQNKYEVAETVAEQAAAINRQGNEWWKNQILLLQIEGKKSPQKAASRLESLLVEAKKKSLEMSSPILWAILVNEQGVLLLGDGQAESAKVMFNKVLEKGNLDAVWVLVVRSNLALCAEQSTDYMGALQTWQEILEKARKLAEREIIATALEGVGRCELRLGNTEEARVALQRAMDNYGRLNMSVEQTRVKELLEILMKEITK